MTTHEITRKFNLALIGKIDPVQTSIVYSLDFEEPIIELTEKQKNNLKMLME